MSILKKIQKRSLRRKLRVRSAIRSDHKNNKVRVSVFRSLKHLYAQAIDDSKQITVSSISSQKEDLLKKPKKEASYETGKIFAENLKKEGIEEAIFDRGKYLYHGRIQSFVEGLRDGGLKI